MSVVAELSDEQIASRLAALRGDAEVAERPAATQGDSAEGGASTLAGSNAERPAAPLSNVPVTIEEGLAVIQNRLVEADAARADAASRRFRFVRPLSEAADSLIGYLQNSEGRFMFGLAELDMMTRGLGPGELSYLIGYTHSGKTQVFLTGCVNNRDRHILLVTMDETAEQVLTKLVCMRTGSNAERLEERVKAGDNEAIARVRQIARNDFKNLIVVDGTMRIDDLSTVVAEAEAYWGAPCDMLGLDYLELLKSEESQLEGKSQALKSWTVNQRFPVVCIHQGSRGNSGQGQKLSLNSMKYAGEAEATFVIGVRRLRDDPDLADDPSVRDTVEVHLIKNKRPPSRTGEYTYFMAPESGMVLPMDLAPQPQRPTLGRPIPQSPGQQEMDV